MSKIICDICGTVYPDTAAVCPICGFPQKESTVAADNASIPAGATGAAAATAASRTKGGHFSNKNVKKRNLNEVEPEKRPRREKPVMEEPAPKPEKAPKAEKPTRKERPAKEPEYEERSNRGLVIIAIILAIAVLLVSGYIISRFIGGRDAYDNPNAPVIGTNPSAETTLPTETTLPVETGVPCAGLTISDAAVEFLGANRSWKLSISTTPADTTDELIITSSDESVVTVTPDGRLTSVGPGTATITITCGEVVKECQVTCDFELETEPVENTEPEETTAPTEPEETTKPTEPETGDGLKLSHEDVSLFYEGESFTISAKWNGSWLGNAQVTWTSADPEVAKVENGKVTAVGAGYTTITATYSGKTAKCIVRCRFEDGTEETTKPTEGNTSTAKWSISHTDVSINVGESFTLRITDENGNVANVSWSASTPGIANVNGNTVTGAVSGMTTLSATVDGQTFSCIVRVR